MASSSSAADDQSPPLQLPLIEEPPSDHHPPPDPPPSFLHGRRPLRDLPFLLLFLLLLLSTLALGIFSLVHRSSSSSCDSVSSNSLPFPPLSSLLPTLAITLLLSPLLALSLLFLLRRYPKHIVYPSLPALVLLPLALNLYWFIFCTLSTSCSAAFPLPYRIPTFILILFFVALLVWIIVVNWHRVELTVQIVQIAADALSLHRGLFLALSLVGLAGIAYVALVIVFLVFAPGNGKFVSRETGECVWRQDRWVPAYFALGIITALWVLAVTVESQVFVIGGTVGQWYFAKEGERPERSIRHSLRHAFGSSFGTLCFSGVTLGLVRIVRGIVDSAERESGSTGIVNCFLQCSSSLLSPIGFINKFTINFAAITGEAYCSSARMSYELLRRNLLSTVSVETVSTRILVGIIFVVSAVYAIVVCVILRAITALEAEVYLVTILAWALLIVMLGFFVHVLDNVVDAVYICYAIDRDNGEVTRQEVHEVYAQLPASRGGRSSLAIRRPLLV